jgi:hypothetical protein
MNIIISHYRIVIIQKQKRSSNRFYKTRLTDWKENKAREDQVISHNQALNNRFTKMARNQIRTENQIRK